MFVENKIENIAFPIILKKFSSYFINEEDLEKFKRFLLLNYYKEFCQGEVIGFLNPRIKIPYYLFSKIFVRLYSMGTNFYRDMNYSLRNNNYSDFKVFIFTLYNGLDRKVLKDIHNVPLYRGATIRTDEYKKIVKSNGLVLTSNFLTLSKDRNVAESFCGYSSDSYSKSVLFIVNPLNESKDTRVTNIDTKEFSYIPDEEEVLFLPFSGFEISRCEETEKYAIIYLNYLNKYEKKIKDYIDAKSKDKVEKFLKSLIKESKSSIYKNIIIMDRSIFPL